MIEHPFAPLLLFLGLTGGGYALGTWLGKVFAALLDRDRREWGDWGGISLGLFGFGLSLGYFFWRWGCMNRRPSWTIALGGFLAAFVVGIALAQLDLGYAAVLVVGLLATLVLGAIGLCLELLRQNRAPDDRRLRV